MAFGTLTEALIDNGILHSYVGHLKTFLLPALVAAAAFTYAMYRGCRLPTASLAICNDNRAPFVYLRSFRDEGIYRIQPSWRQGGLLSMAPIGVPLEGILAAAVEDHGPFVALAKPGQRIPVDGAARDSVDGDWKSHITSFLRKAGVVFVLPGLTENLLWELNWLNDEGMLHKLVMVLPPIGRSRRLEHWKKFCQVMHLDHLLQLPPDGEIQNSANSLRQWQKSHCNT